MRIWDEVRAELEKVRAQFTGDIASLRAEVADLKSARQGETPAAPAADTEISAEPTP